MGGATVPANVHNLVLHEPSLGLAYPPGSIERIDVTLARGDHDAAIVAVLVDIRAMTDDGIDGLRASPLWPIRLAAAPTIPWECLAEEGWVYQRGQFDRITAPTLMLTRISSYRIPSRRPHMTSQEGSPDASDPALWDPRR